MYHTNKRMYFRKTMMVYHKVEKFTLHIYKTLYVKLTLLFHLYMYFLLSRYAWTKNFANILGWFVIAYTSLSSRVPLLSWLKISAEYVVLRLFYNAHSNKKCFSSSTASVLQNRHSRWFNASPINRPVSILSSNTPLLN